MNNLTDKKQASLSSLEDSDKRQTIKRLGFLPVLTLPIALPASLMADRAGSSSLEITLISKTDTSNLSLVLNNLSDQNIEIREFFNANIAYDGERINANDALSQGPVRLSSFQSKLIQFKHTENNLWQTLGNGAIEADKILERLSEGTRIIRLNAQVKVNTAILAIRPIPIA